MDVMSFYPAFIAVAVLAISWLVYALLRFPLYQLRGSHFAYPESPADGSVPLSVVVVVHGSSDDLERNLEVLATQNYLHYEVIVVEDASVDGVTDAIKRIGQRFPHVRHTFLPQSARYVSRSKLAVTLGVKAARNEWIVLTESDCIGESRDRLGFLAAACDESHDIVLGYTGYDDNGTWLAKRYALDNLVRQLRFFRAAAKRRNGKAVGGCIGNIAFRKSLFMENRGFSSNLSLLGGEDILLADSLARPGRTGVIVNNETMVHRQPPKIKAQWHTMKLFQAESARYISAAGRKERHAWAVSDFCYSLSLWATAVPSVMFVYEKQFAFAAAIVMAELLFVLLDDVLFNRVSGAMGQGRCYFMYPCYNLTQPVYNLYYRLKSKKQRNNLMRGL